MLGVAWYVYGMTQFDAGMFDKLLGLAAGVAAGMILAHSLVSDPGHRRPAAARRRRPWSRRARSAASCIRFPTYHSVMDTITGATTYRRELPNVDGK